MKLLSLFFCLFTISMSVSQPMEEAPRQGAADRGNWASGVKEIFGTAYESYDSDLKYSEKSSTAPLSKVWFTGSEKLLSEIYWPTLDTAQTRDTELLVSDGQSFLWNERGQANSEIVWMQKGVPAFHITHKDSQNRFQIEKWIVTDPDRDSLIVKIKFTRFVKGLHLYVMHKPACHNTPMGDSARVDLGSKRKALVAWESTHAQALMSDVGFLKSSAYFIGPFDGYSDLSSNFQMDQEFLTATEGNVGLLAELNLPREIGSSEMNLVLAFATSPDKAIQVANETLTSGIEKQISKYLKQWPEYLNSIQDLSSASLDQGALFWASVSMIKAMEDKTYEGAFVAAPSIPWGPHRRDWADALKGDRAWQTGGYHLVWPRDLYQMATTMMAIGDFKGARTSLNRLRAVQFGPASGTWEFGNRKRPRDGSFPQNFWMDGTPYWDSLQLDEASMPVILTYRLWKEKHIALHEYWDMVLRATDFVADFGPWSAQERWEELFGVSPSTVAAEISALWAAASMAESMGDLARAQRYRSLADSWSSKPGDNIEAWTFTSTGDLGNGKYFERLEGASYYDQVWNPNDDLEYAGANGSGLKKEKNIVDGGFLELVRLGVRSANAPSIVESLPEYDQSIRTDVPGFGPGFKRYIGDQYNQDERTGEGRPGMLWPLLTGERAHYEMAKILDQKITHSAEDLEKARLEARPYLLAMESFATPTKMLPEQVWDVGQDRGQPTGAATPLGWAHGEYIKLLRSLRDVKVFDRIMDPTARQ